MPFFYIQEAIPELSFVLLKERKMVTVEKFKYSKCFCKEMLSAVVTLYLSTPTKAAYTIQVRKSPDAAKIFK